MIRYFKNRPKLLIVLSLFMVVSLFCYVKTKIGIQYLSDSVKMKEETLRHIPIGTPIVDAEQIMNRSGFGCENHKNDKLYVQELGGMTRGDYLFCEASQSYFLAKDIWKVFIFYQNNKVIMIYANVSSMNL
jgi:hypothetical protein